MTEAQRAPCLCQHTRCDGVLCVYQQEHEWSPLGAFAEGLTLESYGSDILWS